MRAPKTSKENCFITHRQKRKSIHAEASNIHVGCCIFSQFSEAAGTDAAAILIFQSSFGKIV